MGQQATITINDGAATPIAHNFTPSGSDKDGIYIWHDRSASSPLGYARMTATLRSPLPNGSTSSSDRVYRLKIKIDTPILDSALAVPTKAYVNTFNGEFVIPERSVLADRKNILAYAKNLLANAVITSYVHDLEPVV